tara:strand:- start:48 stop:1934 length:1887 start_codon:yes stop_codon:yes gene_type:complete
MKEEAFLHGSLHHRLEPEVVVNETLLKHDIKMMAFQEVLEDEMHFLYEFDEAALEILLSWIVETPFAIGYQHTVGTLLREHSPYIKYKKPTRDALTRQSQKGQVGADSITVTTLGETDGLNQNWVYLIDDKGVIRAIFIDPKTKDKGQLRKPDKVYDWRTDSMVELKEGTSASAYSPLLCNISVDMVNQFFSDRYHEKISPYLQYHIDINTSMVSKLDNIDISIDKSFIFNSPFLEDGAHFKYSIGKNKWRDVSIWMENNDRPISSGSNEGNRIYVFIMDGDGDGYDDHYLYFFDYEELPDKLTNHTLKQFFKKRTNNNKKSRELRLEEEKKYIADKLGFSEDDINHGETRSNVQLNFFNYAVTAHNFSQLTEDNEVKERIELPEILIFLLKLICAYEDPELRGELKRKEGKHIYNYNNRNSVHSYYKWEWGTDRYTYISTPITQGHKLQHRTLVREHITSRYISNYNKYKDRNPRKLLNPIQINGHDRTHIVSMKVKGYWKGEGEELRFPRYYAGRLKRGRSSTAELNWLNEIMNKEGINIQHTENGNQLKIPHTPYYADGFCKETNTIYEYHGCYFHGCPTCFPDRDKKHPLSKDKTFEQVYQNSNRRDKIIKSLGYNLIIKWGCD